jgi:hypothetical protein
LRSSLSVRLVYAAEAQTKFEQARSAWNKVAPTISAREGIVFGLTTVGTAAVLGSVVAIVFVPKHFGMPSLMAELGTIEPKFDALVMTVLASMGMAILALGMAPTALQLARRSIVATLSEERG